MRAAVFMVLVGRCVLHSRPISCWVHAILSACLAPCCVVALRSGVLAVYAVPKRGSLRWRLPALSEFSGGRVHVGHGADPSPCPHAPFAASICEHEMTSSSMTHALRSLLFLLTCVLSSSSNAAMAFLPAAPMGLRSSPAVARAGRAPLALRMQQATVDRAQDVGVGQDSMRKDAESLMQPCPETKYSLHVASIACGPKHQDSMFAYTPLPFPARCAFSDSAGHRWGNRNLDVLAAQKSVQDMQLPAFPLEVAKPASMTELDAQEAYFRENKAEILDNLQKHGAVVVRGFELSKTPEGFERMWKALGMEACLDPLHSVAGRPVVSGKSAVYEAVNKPSRSKFYVGMHNEMVGKRTVRRAAFVCFKSAEVGGEFIITDGCFVCVVRVRVERTGGT